MAKKRTKSGNLPAKTTSKDATEAKLLADLRELIESARKGVALAVNSGQVLLYWRVGERILTEVLRKKRATYGEEIVATVSRQLTTDYGRGFAEKSLRRMIQFAQVFPDHEIVAALSRELSWSHIVEIIPLKDELRRDFYAEMCRIERWGVRTLREKVGGMLFERTALSRKPGDLARKELAALRDEDRMTPDLVFRDPYFLDFLGLKDTYSEKDLEAAILREIEQFILELGVGFTFVARQKRIVIDGEDFYIDLLFYHRKLHCLVVIDLKLERFKAADKGQMELYLRWLEKYEIEPGEETPIGLILCADKRDEQIELLQLEKSGIRVSLYLTELPPKKLLEQKLRESAHRARAELEGRPPEA